MAQQLARPLNRPVTVARAIYPLIKKGWVQLVYPTAARTSSRLDSSQFSPAKIPKIVCIHQDLTNQVSKATFSQYQQKIEVVFLDNTQNALGHLFEIKPDLIFCDLMPSSSAPGLSPYANYCI